MFSLIISTPSLGGSAHGMGYLYMAGTGSLLVLTALLRRSSWQPWTTAVWSVGLGIVAISFPALWWEQYESGLSSALQEAIGLNKITT